MNHHNHQPHHSHGHHDAMNHDHHQHDAMMNHHQNHQMSQDEDPSAEPEGQQQHLHHGGHSMMMYFHGGVTEVILFDFWRIDSVGGLVGSMFACFFMAVAYEGLKSFRDYLYSREWEDKQKKEAAATTSNGQNGSSRNGRGHHRSSNGGHNHDDREANAKKSRSGRALTLLRTLETSMWSARHAAQTALHLLQVSLSYLIMLVFMTYNSWLCGAVLAGLAVGYFLFGWRKTTIVLQDAGDCCH